jgi:hypothetical protein
MRDRDIFESRLSVALERYADLGALELEPRDVARVAAQAGGRRIWLPVSLVRIALLALLAALAAGAAVVVGSWLDHRPLNGTGGTVFVWTPNRDGGGAAFLVAADGSATTRIDLGEVRHCAHYVPVRHEVAWWGGNTGLHLRAGDGRASRDLPVGDASTPGGDIWSPSGRRVALRTDRYRAGVTLLDVVDGTTTDVGTGSARAWSVDGSRFAIISQVGPDLLIEEARADGTGRREIGRYGYDLATSGAPEVRWSPDGTLIAAGDPSSATWRLFEVASSTEVAATGGTTGDIRRSPDAWAGSFTLSPDGLLVAFVRGTDLVAAHVDGSAEVTHRVSFSPRALAWRPDSSEIAIQEAARDGTAAVVVYPALASGAPRRIGGVPDPEENGWYCFGWYEG